MFSKNYLIVNDAIHVLRQQDIPIRLSDLQDLARDRIITPLIYVDVDFVNSTYPTGDEVEPKRINERHCFTRFNGYVLCKNANVLDAYVGRPSVNTSYSGDLFLHDTDLLFEVVDCLQAKTNVVSNGKIGYLFEPFRMGSSGRHSSFQRISIEDVRLHRDDVEIIANIAEKSVDKQKIIDGLTSQLAAAIAQLESSKESQELNQRASIDDDKLNERSEKSYLHTIGLLIEVLTEPRSEGGTAPFSSEAMIIGKISDKGVYGQAKSKLGERFKEAKDALFDERKKKIKSLPVGMK